MSTTDWAYLAARTSADFANGGHRTYFVPSLNAVANTANDMAALAEDASDAAAAAAATYTLNLALGVSAYGVGTEPLDLPRTVDLGGAAFVETDVLLGVFPSTQNAAYQMLPTDFRRLLLTTTGTNTWTLPLAADLPDGWHCWYRNRSGANLTIQRSGSDTFNAAATSVTISTGAAIGMIVKTSSTTFEVA
jgi:hypothetical protein